MMKEDSATVAMNGCLFTLRDRFTGFFKLYYTD